MTGEIGAMVAIDGTDMIDGTDGKLVKLVFRMHSSDLSTRQK